MSEVWLSNKIKQCSPSTNWSINSFAQIWVFLIFGGYFAVTLPVFFNYFEFLSLLQIFLALILRESNFHIWLYMSFWISFSSYFLDFLWDSTTSLLLYFFRILIIVSAIRFMSQAIFRKGNEQFVTGHLRWLLGCWPSVYYMPSLLMGDLSAFSYIKVHHRHCFLLIVRVCCVLHVFIILEWVISDLWALFLFEPICPSCDARFVTPPPLWSCFVLKWSCWRALVGTCHL